VTHKEQVLNEWLKVIILGIVEGITEFLPISSTGHLIVTAALLDFQNSLNGTFEIFIQLGAVIAVLLYYRHDLFQQVRRLPSDRNTQRFWLAVLVGCMPAGLVGFLLRDWITGDVYKQLPVIAIALIIGGIVFLLVERNPKAETEAVTTDIAHITLRQAIIIGIAQMTALIPGVSRSGASIIGGMQAGLSRQAATRFSFYLAIPVLAGATLVSLLDAINEINSAELALLVVGTAVSALVSWLSIGWLLRFVSRNTFVVFGYYRIATGAIILLMVAFHIV
jgi:undecaprenyl-diphosphatase